MSSATPGPSRPAPQPTLPPARARVAALLGELGEGVPLAELATRIGGHPNATRAHLDALVEEGLAEAAPLPRTGPGRPALGWTLTDAGRRAVAGDPSADDQWSGRRGVRFSTLAAICRELDCQPGDLLTYSPAD